MRWTVISLGVSTGLTGCKPTPPHHHLAPQSTPIHGRTPTVARSSPSWMLPSLDTTGVLSRLFQPPRSSPAHNITLIPSSYIIRGQPTSGQLRSLLDHGVPSCLAWAATPPAQNLRPAAVLCGGECCSKWCSAVQRKANNNTVVVTEYLFLSWEGLHRPGRQSLLTGNTGRPLCGQLSGNNTTLTASLSVC
ncbi:hypothetical protein BP00DRAFT_205778 [Aspergillus indologenus CBS 114.80]|uniref:Uncharacterized protein n=1 Tax=Aspergillus indologenus CBS 114.80 TaxID=1450541 RepID=A0A2V5I0W5_9EURO|nr:hypothetical protein BP00DRAFT_205778 [Aspergillus indologenus CBS 114.80]